MKNFEECRSEIDKRLDDAWNDSAFTEIESCRSIFETEWLKSEMAIFMLENETLTQRIKEQDAESKCV